MIKRFLDCTSSDFLKMNKTDLTDAIRGSEGRILIGETIGSLMPMLGDVTNAEFTASMGADMIILNIFDVRKPVIHGMPKVQPSDTIKELKRLIGRPIGINLEPVEQSLTQSSGQENVFELTDGRRATLENAEAAVAMGADFIVLTGNPGIGVTNQGIVESLRLISGHFGERIMLIAGKMHASGILGEAAESIITKEDIKQFADAGADVILLPAPATVPGITMELVRELVSYAHSLGKLTLTAVGTSQEGADEATIREIALLCKMTGTDMHHLGDSGYGGMALPENLLAYSKVIRGIRHTYRRIAMSVNR